MAGQRVQLVADVQGPDCCVSLRQGLLSLTQGLRGGITSFFQRGSDLPEVAGLQWTGPRGPAREAFGQVGGPTGS